MTKQAEAYEKILTATLQRVIDFLKFAEAKNAALLAIASGWVVASLNLECSGHAIPGSFTVCVPLAMLCSMCAGGIALVSFFPRLHLPFFLGGRRAGPHSKNLLYFGDICSLPIKSLQNELLDRYLPNPEDAYRDEYLHDLTVQISVNSDIVMRKMLLFRIGIGFISAAVISLIIPAILMLLGAAKALW